MIVLNDLAHADLIGAACNYVVNPRTDMCISREKDGKLLGGVIYTNYTGRSISLHMAGFTPHWMSRELIWMAFDYPFNQLGVERVFGEVPSNNRKALDIDTKLGFTEAARLKGVFPDADLIVLEMEREHCQWLNLKPRLYQRGANNGKIEST